MTTNYADIFNQFASEVRQGLPFCQILNAPNLDKAQLDKLQPPHGVFISKENAEMAGLITDGMLPHEQSFRDGEEIVEGFILSDIRFIVLHVTPLVVQSGKSVLGFYFAENGNGVSEFGKLVNQISEIGQTYHCRSWWLIVPLNKNNQIISTSPIQLSLRGAVGAALSQERKKAIQELEIEFFKKTGKARQTLTDKAHSFFVMDWVLSPYKATGKAPHEFVSARLGITLEPTEIYRYGSGKDSRKVVIMPESLENLLIIPSSQVGQTISQWYKEYEEAFFKKIKAIGTIVPAEEIEKEENLDSSLAIPLEKWEKAALGMDIDAPF